MKRAVVLRRAPKALRDFLHSSPVDHSMGFASLKGDPDLRFKPQVKPDGSKYYEYLLLYIDDMG